MKPTTVLKATRHNSVEHSMQTSNSSDLLGNPVALELLKQLEQSRSGHRWIEEKAVLKVGQTFIGMKMPKGFRKMKQKQCFGNAAKLALHNRRSRRGHCVPPRGRLEVRVLCAVG